MATNPAIGPELLDKAFEVGGERTKKATVTRALEEYTARPQQARILELFGTFDSDHTYDYKVERTRQ